MSTIGANIYHAIQVWKPAVKTKTENDISYLKMDRAVFLMRIGTVAAISFASAIWVSASSGLIATSLVTLPVTCLVTLVALCIFGDQMNTVCDSRAIEIFINRTEIPSAVLKYLFRSEKAVTQLLKQNAINFRESQSLSLLGTTLFSSPNGRSNSYKLMNFKMLMNEYQQQLVISESVDLSKLDLQGDSPFNAILNLPLENAREKSLLFKQVVNFLNQPALLNQKALDNKIKYSYLMRAAEETQGSFLLSLVSHGWLQDFTADDLIHLICNIKDPWAIKWWLAVPFDINTKNDQGMTPLLHLLYHVPPHENKVALLKEFLKYGADLTATTTVNGEKLSVANYLNSDKCYPGFKTVLTKNGRS